MELYRRRTRLAGASSTARWKIVRRDRKASTSYLQRRLQIGYNRAATLIERMEKEGVISEANAAGKREILLDVVDED
jgi:S-DNA-T family DNA segregation ATPase FtsK/SpoIIIE